MPKTVPTPRAVSSFTAREIAYLLKRARLIFTNPYFSIKTSPHSSLYSKILVIASKKMGNAPMRNLIKRRLKSLFYEEKLFTNPFDVVVYCKKGAEHLPYSDLITLISDTLESAQKRAPLSQKPVFPLQKPH
ncbi:ribonuclease P protein component [Candidatus Dependentiae bacterium]|nr:ribonuclease P protein component [Candidatus Dependentiae bacterium]